jgi:hypothetical protein
MAQLGVPVDGRCENIEPTIPRIKVKRRRHDPQFKAKLALQALKGVKTIQEIAKEFEVHPVRVSVHPPAGPLAGAGRERREEFARNGCQGLSSARKYTRRAVGEGFGKVWEVTAPWEGMAASISESQFERSVDQARR